MEHAKDIRPLATYADLLAQPIEPQQPQSEALNKPELQPPEVLPDKAVTEAAENIGPASYTLKVPPMETIRERLLQRASPVFLKEFDHDPEAWVKKMVAYATPLKGSTYCANPVRVHRLMHGVASSVGIKYLPADEHDSTSGG